MKVAIVYSSHTGNTKLLASTIQGCFNNSEVVYCGTVNDEIPEADIYFIGSWTDKGNASNEIIEFIEALNHKQVAIFGTAGFGGSQEYFKTLFERVQKHINSTNQVLGYFYCQGKMPMQVRDRYVKMITEHPDDANLKVSIQNFDEALTHPDTMDLNNVVEWVKNTVNSN